jgi:hypothetical protein
MRFGGFWMSTLAMMAGGCVAGRAAPVNVAAAHPPVALSGIWDGVSQTTIADGTGAGDTRIEKQEWHLTQAGDAITGYYIAALTYVSGDGRPYVCNRQPQFSATQRFDVAGHVRGGLIELEERNLAVGEVSDSCDPGQRELAHYRGRLDGDVLTLTSGGERRTLYRSREPERLQLRAAAQASESPPAPAAEVQSVAAPAVASEGPAPSAMFSATTDISGLWVWEHRGLVAGGDEKQEREEWHVTQNGSKVTGYYDRIVHQVSADGHAYRCSMALDFQIATRYQFSGELQGSQLMIYESSFEVLAPSACDNGRRRLDAYEGQASPDEIRLIWGVGGQVLRRPRPDVPTQRF